MSIMANEIAQIPEAARRLLSRGDKEIAALGRELRSQDFSYVIICGRGSSSHAGVHLRYLVETMLGYGVSNSAPSVITGYDVIPKMRNALFIVVSQSGRSPDLVAATKAAREAGALTIAIANDATSPVAEAADRVVPIHAGNELAVAATKSVTNSLLAGALLVAHAAGNHELLDALHRMPRRLEQALTLDWSLWGDVLSDAKAAFVTGRGFGYSSAREIALKLSETVGIPALAYSAAELRHGPRAAVTKDTPVLALRQNDAMSASIDALVSDLCGAGVPIFMCGGSSEVPWIGDDHPALDPIAMLVPAYKVIEQEACRRGLDPDKPAGLKKITETL